MTYVKLVTLAVFMLTTFLIVETMNIEARLCPTAGTACSQRRGNSCGGIECICVSQGYPYDGGICKSRN
ncbi:hypothetical protein MtrunA17_Chr3g0092901 [Medicago truncatula]|uniref:Leginsulin related MtN11/16/17 family n=1 Tax=Medicago truncatula TaxID=3880 RepID=O24095_MEDTR|nr:leginsulin related MtN11/16/17 family [Medicago truncatula]RHN66595.1 hypothetical protein MtrunA17_Chr3g0092901 [Medicago truncatula]CAA75586.1 MtN16 [Medicago truncatula]